MQSCSQIVITNKPTSRILQARCPSCRPTNSVRALKANIMDREMKNNCCCPLVSEMKKYIRHTYTVVCFICSSSLSLSAPRSHGALSLTATYTFTHQLSTLAISASYAPPLIGGGIKRCFCLTSVCRVHRA